jgi:chromosome partitioning protein
MMAAIAGLGWPGQPALATAPATTAVASSSARRPDTGSPEISNTSFPPATGFPPAGAAASTGRWPAAGLGWPATSALREDAAASRPPARLRQVLAGVSRETPAIGTSPASDSTHIQAAVTSTSLAHEPVPTGTAGERDMGKAGLEPVAAAPTAVGLARAAPGVTHNGSGESEDDVAIAAGPGGSVDTPIARAAQAAVVARSGGEQWPRPGSCRIMTIANQKGGVGKTTTAVNLAASLAMHGSRVLVIDLDPQGNASTALDVAHHSGVGSVYNVLVEGQPLSAVVSRVEGFTQLYCAPATIDLAGAEIELVPMVAREQRLARAVAQYDASELDYILIDCPPSLGLLTVNALVAAPEVLIPIQCEYYALEGLEQLLRTVELVRSHLNPDLTVTTIVLTMFDARTRLASQVADEVREHFGEVVLGSVIPRSVRVSEAPSYGQSVMTYDPGSSGAQAYMEAARELAFRSGQLAVR